MKEAIVYVGIDVAKAYLDVAWQEQRQRVPNDAIGRNQLLKRLKQINGPVQGICEASGGYERGVVRALASWWIQGECGAGQSGTTVRAGRWHFGQDRLNRRAGA